MKRNTEDIFNFNRGHGKSGMKSTVKDWLC